MPTPRKEREIQTLERLESQSPGSPYGTYFHQTIHGTVYHNVFDPFPTYDEGTGGGGGGSTTLKEFIVSSVTGDYLICNEVTRDAQGSASWGVAEFTVAKPYDLRWSTWSGSTSDATYPGDVKTYKSGSVTTYTETLNPLYENAAILAASNNTLYMGTGSYSSASLSGSAIVYTDINIDARKYLPTPQTMEICITSNGVSTKKNFVYFGGAPYV